MQLSLARHGETDWNAAGRIQGQLDIPLNARGHQQAAALAHALAGQHFDAVYCSDLARARETAAPVAGRLGVPLTVSAIWRERHHGRMQGQTYAELAAAWPDGHRRLRARDPHFDVDGGESLVQLTERCRQALADLATRHREQSVLVITHGGLLDVLYRLVTGEPLHTPRQVAIRNGALHRLQLGSQGWQLLSWGSEAHLDHARDELPDA